MLSTDAKPAHTIRGAIRAAVLLAFLLIGCEQRQSTIHVDVARAEVREIPNPPKDGVVELKNIDRVELNLRPEKTVALEAKYLAVITSKNGRIRNITFTSPQANKSTTKARAIDWAKAIGLDGATLTKIDDWFSDKKEYPEAGFGSVGQFPNPNIRLGAKATLDQSNPWAVTLTIYFGDLPDK
jgi:hypothetical protein